VAYFSRRLIPAEENYDTPEKEMLAVVKSFKHWRHYLEGARYEIQLRTDHKNHESFFRKQILSRRQARWAEQLSGYDVKINYKPGKENPADALSRRPDYQPTSAVVAGLQTIETIEVSWTNLSAATLKNRFAQGIVEDLKNPEFGNKDDWSMENGVLHRRGLIYVPSEPLRVAILAANHDAPAVGHPGMEKTEEILTRNFYWPGLAQMVKDYVRSCEVCQRVKPKRHKPSGELEPLPIPDEKWKSLTVDFVTDLPPAGIERFDSICVVVDRFTKMAHYSPCHKTVTAQKLAHLFLRDIYKLHGLPETIISDRGSVFASTFWTELCRSLRIDRRMSTAFHPATDGQTERQNSTMEAYLRAYVNYQQDDWHTYLPLAEFAHNNSVNATTKMTPFMANYGFNPRFNFDSVSTSEKKKSSTAALLFKNEIERLNLVLKDRLSEATTLQSVYYDRGHEPLSFEKGEKVYLSTKNLKTKRKSKKLDYKRIGPFEILEKIGSSAYKLSLPSSYHIHPVFHVGLLEPYVENTFRNRYVDPPHPTLIDGEWEYETEEILDSRYNKRKREFQYLVKWKDYDNPKDNTWETIDDVSHSADLIETFHAKYPDKPRPLSRA
jgi:RNase H-like domain found in reverse transcriptase/Integrase zinc binding domain/Chromo (CHRromatin Organisation MOdifier) domain/Integrase core domain